MTCEGSTAGGALGADAQGQHAAGLYLAHLIGCGLHGERADALPAGTTWEKVYQLAAYNSVEGVSWFGARMRDNLPSNVRSRWEDAANTVLYRKLMFDVEREQVLAAMDARGLAHLPLKGILMAEYYPHPEMRSMADNDILYGYVEAAPQGGWRLRGESERGRARAVREATGAMAEIMRERGYQAVSLHKGNHDSFHRAPLYNFEMHRCLVSPASPHYAYYANPWSRAIQDTGNPLAFSFCAEDEYLYLLAHLFKHFDGSGCGIRGVVDVQVFLEVKGAALDGEYVQAELERLGLTEFEQRMRSLAAAAFGPAGCRGELSVQDMQLLSHLLGCGTYGNMTGLVERRLSRLREHGGAGSAGLWVRYLARRFIPAEEDLRQLAPVFCDHRVLMPLLPFYRVYRLVRRLVTDPTCVRNELVTLGRVRRREREEAKRGAGDGLP